MIPSPRPTREQMLSSPAEHAPPGVVADFVHPWSMKTSAEGALIALYILTTIVVWIRFYAQRRLSGKFVPEDYVVALTWVRAKRFQTVLAYAMCTYSTYSLYTRELLCLSVCFSRARPWECTSGISH